MTASELAIFEPEDLIFEENPEVLPQALREGQRQDYDNTWKAHRECSIKSLNKFDWAFPTTKKEREEGIGTHKEVSAHFSHHFCALRGIILGFHYGASLDDNSDPQNFKNVCRTTRLVEHLGENSTDTVDNHPLKFPFGQMHKNKTEPHVFNPQLDKEYMVLYGSRPPVGADPNASFSTPRTCKSCVEAGEHYLHGKPEGTGGDPELFNDKNAQFAKCTMGGYALIAVFQLGIYNYDIDTEEATIKWVSIEDAKINTMEGDQKVPLKRPFILKLKGLTKSQHADIGTGAFDRNVVPESHIPSEIYSTGEYFKYLHDQKYTGTRHRVLKGGQLCYPVVTEVHCGHLEKQQYGQDYIPVFHPVSDKAVIDAGAGWIPLDWVRHAMAILKLEREVANGKASFESAPKLPTLKAVPNQPAPTPTATSEVTTSKTASAPAVAKSNPALFNAFAPKKPAPETAVAE